MRCILVMLLVASLAATLQAETDADKYDRIQKEKRERQAAEAAAVVQFNKDYRSVNVNERIQALEALKQAHERPTWARLSVVVTQDPDKSVQDKALQVLCSGVDKDGALSLAVVQLCQHVKRGDQKVDYAEAMGVLEFKFAALDYMITNLMQALVYPMDPARGNYTNAAAYETDRKIAENARKLFARFLVPLNKLSGQDFQPSYTVKNEIREWWIKSGKQEIAQLDMKLKEAKAKE